MAVQDILLNESFEIEFKDGDFKIGDSDKNHIALIIRTAVGNWKEFPLVGVGIDYYLASSGNESLLKRNISVQLGADNYKVKKLQMETTSNTEITYSIDAERIQ